MRLNEYEYYCAIQMINIHKIPESVYEQQRHIQTHIEFRNDQFKSEQGSQTHTNIAGMPAIMDGNKSCINRDKTFQFYYLNFSEFSALFFFGIFQGLNRTHSKTSVFE